MNFLNLGQQDQRRIAIVCLVTIVFIINITVLSLSSIQPRGSIGPIGIDKACHFLAFAVLVLPLSFIWPRLRVWILLCVISFGGLIELLQHLFGRQAEWNDFLANGIGSISGVAFARQLGIWNVVSCVYNIAEVKIKKDSSFSENIELDGDDTI